MRIVYMGTPGFAVEPLRRLLDAGHEVLAVVTAPDRPAGRGQALHQSDVKRFALERGLTVLQPIKLRDEEFLGTLASLGAELFVVVAFRMLPAVVWEMPPLGTINLHASLLPQYRGAAPINWAIINGEVVTGVTTFFITHEIDTGALLLQAKAAIGADESAGELHDKLMHLGADLLARTVADIANGCVVPRPQQGLPELRHAPKLFKEHCRISWGRGPLELHNLVRGLCPVPTAWAELRNGRGELAGVKLYRTAAETADHALAFGSVVTDGRTYLKVACRGGFLHLVELQLQGKKRLGVKEFLAGYRSIEQCVFQ